MTIEKNQPSGFTRFLRGLLKLVLSIIIGLLIGAGLYFGFQYVYRQVVTSIEQNTVSIQNLNTRMNQQWDLLNEKNVDIEERLTLLETNQDTTMNQISDMMVQIDQNAADMDAFELKYDDLYGKIDIIDKAILELTKQDIELTKRDSEFSTQNEDFQTTLDNMDVEKKIQPLQQDVAIFRIMLQINRSRIFLLQNNLGLAKDELTLAQSMMNSSLSMSTSQQEEEIQLWNARLELAISHLPDNPILANDDLEILWTMMASGYDDTNQLVDLESDEELEED